MNKSIYNLKIGLIQYDITYLKNSESQKSIPNFEFQEKRFIRIKT